MALSTSGPMASDRPASVMTLIVLPVVIQADDRRQNRDGDGDDGDQRHPPFAQEDEDHQRAEDGPQHALLHQALDGVLHVNGLVHHELRVMSLRVSLPSCPATPP